MLKNGYGRITRQTHTQKKNIATGHFGVHQHDCVCAPGIIGRYTRTVTQEKLGKRGKLWCELGIYNARNTRVSVKMRESQIF